MKTSWGRLEDVFCLRIQKTSWKRLQDVFFKTNMFVLAIRLQDVFKMFSRCLQDVFKTSCQDVFKTSSRRLAKASSRHLQESSRCFENVFKTSSRHLQDILQRCLQNVFKGYYQVKLFVVTQFQDVFETYLKRFWDVLLSWLSTGGLPRSQFCEIYCQCTKFPRMIKVSQALVFHFTTPFSVCFREAHLEPGRTSTMELFLCENT